MIGPPQALAPRTPRQRRIATAGSFDCIVQTDGAEPVERPISSDDIARIASRGYPLWESIDDMRLRNQRITVAYADLSDRLAALIADTDAGRDANWCTFGTWTSNTVGAWIGDDVVPEPLRNLRNVPKFVVRPLIAFARWLAQRGNGASYRCLAAGNRFVFLEIGYAVALFLERFGEVDPSQLDDDRWDAYWHDVETRATAMGRLDPSWLLTDAPEPVDLRLGLRQYYEALFASSSDARSEHVLAGNLLIGAYEQRRVDGYVSAALALFTTRAMRNLVHHRTGRLNGWILRAPSSIFSRIMSRGLILTTCEEQLKVGHPLPPPAAPPGAPLFPADLETISNPLAQALLTRYDLSRGRARGRRVRDWTSYDQRMSYITNLFRSRQQQQALFTAPFPPDVEEALLDGRLLDAAETPA